MFVSPLGTIMNADALKGSQLSTELGIFSVKIHTVIGGGVCKPFSSVATTQACCCSPKRAIENMKLMGRAGFQ